MIRNLDDEQAEEIALTVVMDHLAMGVEYLTIVEAIAEEFDGEEELEEPTEHDLEAVQVAITKILRDLQDHLDNQ